MGRGGPGPKGPSHPGRKSHLGLGHASRLRRLVFCTGEVGGAKIAGRSWKKWWRKLAKFRNTIIEQKKMGKTPSEKTPSINHIIFSNTCWKFQAIIVD